MSLAFDDIGPQIVFIVSPQINQQGKKAFSCRRKHGIFAANNPNCPTYNGFHQWDTNNRRIGAWGIARREAPKSPVLPPLVLMTSKDDALRKPVQLQGLSASCCSINNRLPLEERTPIIL